MQFHVCIERVSGCLLINSNVMKKNIYVLTWRAKPFLYSSLFHFIKMMKSCYIHIQERMNLWKVLMLLK